jgi:hypothetical protein
VVSKKRTGNSPEAIEAAARSSRQIILDAKAGVEVAGGVPGRHRGSSEAFYAGRRSLAYELVESGGFNRGRLGLEILYLLPDSFVEAYQNLYHQALTLKDESVMHGRSGGLEKAAGSTGTRLGSEVGTQASSTGKKWKNLPISVNDLGAMRVKESVDKELGVLVGVMKRALESERNDKGERIGPDEWSDGSQGPGTLKKQTYRCQGTVTQLDANYRGAVIGPAMKDGQEVPGDGKVKRLCGRFVKESW